MRYLYSVLFYLALPGILIRLWWRGRRLPAYRQRWQERLGCYPFQLPQCLWIHAVSVGEAIAATPLIRALHTHYPHLPLLITTMTPTGADHIKATFDHLYHAYLPYDVPLAVHRFLRAMRPLLGLIIETELWPNLLAACRQQHIPVCILNARLSEQSAKGYRRMPWITREMLRNIHLIATHHAADAERFIALGATTQQVVITGNLKFDLTLPANLTETIHTLRTSLGENRFIWIAASTHEGEEKIVLAAHQQLCQQDPQALLILVPRHPDRFTAVAKQCRRFFTTQCRTAPLADMQHTTVYLGDTMGELLLLYGVADVAFVGGSFVPIGGHNLLEPAALSKPILTGPHLFNFTEMSTLLRTHHALTIVSDTAHLTSQLTQLRHQPHQRLEMGQNAQQVVIRHRGALQKQLALIQPILTDRYHAQTTAPLL